MEPVGPSQTNNIQPLLSALNLFNSKNKQVRSIVSIALMNAISNSLGLNQFNLNISKGLISASKGPDSQKQQPSTSDIKPNTAQRAWISLTLTGAGVVRNTFFTCSTIPEFLSKMNTLPKNIGFAMIMKSPQTAVYFELLHVFKDKAHHMGISPDIGVPAATALTCTLLNPVTTAQVEFSRQLSNGHQLSKIPGHLLTHFLKNPSHYVTAGLLPTIVRSAVLETVIEAAQNHLGISQKNAIQLSYALAFPLALWGDLNRSGMPFNMTTIRRPPVAAGTVGMALAISIAPGLAEAIHKLFEGIMGKGN
jgi:hypothetical protein